LLALGLGVYLAVVVVSFPASVAYRWFAPDEVALALIQGTIWNGSAAHGGVAGLAFSDLRWQLHPAALLTGRVSVSAETNFATGFARAEIMAAGNRITLNELSAATDLQVFSTLLPLGGVRGQVSISLDSLEFIDGWPTAAIGQTRIANLAMPPLLPIPGVTTIALGNYVAQFSSSDEPGITALLNDQGGPIELTGRLSLAPDRSYDIDTLIKPRADAPTELVQGIEMVTDTPDANGQRRFRLAGTL
jgi:general secretion pathway protein N